MLCKFVKWQKVDWPPILELKDSFERLISALRNCDYLQDIFQFLSFLLNFKSSTENFLQLEVLSKGELLTTSTLHQK